MPIFTEAVPVASSGLWEIMGKESESEVVQSCPTLRNPVDGSLPGSSLHGILQERILEWVAISFSRGSSQLRDRTWVFCIAGRHFNLWATRDSLMGKEGISILSWTKKISVVSFTESKEKKNPVLGLQENKQQSDPLESYWFQSEN